MQFSFPTEIHLFPQNALFFQTPPFFSQTPPPPLFFHKFSPRALFTPKRCNSSNTIPTSPRLWHVPPYPPPGPTANQDQSQGSKPGSMCCNCGERERVYVCVCVIGFETHREQGRAGAAKEGGACLPATWDRGRASLSGGDGCDGKPAAAMARRRWQTSWPAELAGAGKQAHLLL